MRLCSVCSALLDNDTEWLFKKLSLCPKHLNDYQKKHRDNRTDLFVKLVKTGVQYKTRLVNLGHKRGVFCLTCGIYARGLICKSCKKLSKCKLCGIVCKVNPTNKLYTYRRVQGDRKISNELYQEINTKCQTLTKDGLCETCIDWESRVKNICYFCGKNFKNSFLHYRDKGNCCIDCDKQITENIKLTKVIHSLNLSFKN